MPERICYLKGMMPSRTLVLAACLVPALTCSDSKVQDPAADPLGDAGGRLEVAGEPVQCEQTCGTCLSGHECLKEGVKGAVVRFHAACLKVCDSSADCDTGQKCLQPNGLSSSYCISPTLPALCEGSDYAHCDFLGSACSGNILRRETARFGVFCGWEKVLCPGGCVDNDVDAGTRAHCR